MNEGLRVLAERLGINPEFATWRECAETAHARLTVCRNERDATQERLDEANETIERLRGRLTKAVRPAWCMAKDCAVWETEDWQDCEAINETGQSCPGKAEMPPEKQREDERLKDDLRATLGVLASCCYYDHDLLDRRRAMVNTGGPFWKDLDRVEELLWTWEAERMRATKK